MNKTIVLFLALIIHLNVNAQSEAITAKSNTGEKWTTYSDDPYSVRYPANWQLDTSGQMGTLFIVLSPVENETDRFRENVNLLIQDLSGYQLTLDQYVEISEKQVKSMIEASNLLFSERMKANGLEFHKVIYTGKQGNLDLKFEQYYWVEKEEAYVLTLTCQVDQFDQFKATGEKILDSFVIKLE